jgi:hypothetical protein
MVASPLGKGLAGRPLGYPLVQQQGYRASPSKGRSPLGLPAIPSTIPPLY